MDWIRAIGWGLGSVGVLVTFLSLLKAPHWWVRMADFPRVQVLLLLVPVLVGLPLLLPQYTGSDWVLSVLVLVATVYQIRRILPYTPLWRTQVARGRPESATFGRGTGIRILISNVLMDNRNYAALIRLVRNTRPHLLLAVETDGAWCHALRALDADYPHAVEYPLDNTYGLVLRSRLPLRSSRIAFRVSDDVPSVSTQVRLPCGQWVDFYGVHPRPPVPGEAPDSLARDAEVVLVAREVVRAQRPAIVAGDLNDVAWSRTTRLFQREGRLLDPRIGRGIFPTFHADHWFARWPLDHVFHTSDFSFVRLERLDRIGSDHFPILAELRYAPVQAREHDQPTPDAESHREADEKILAAQAVA